MARIAIRLYGPAILPNVTTTIYTVPANSKAIIRHIHAMNNSGTATFTLSIGADATATRIFAPFTIGANTFIDHYGYYVLEAGEIIQARVPGVDSINLTINGDLSVLS